MLEVRGLTRSPTYTMPLSNCARARSSALAGLVGSGRTELLRAIYGLDPAQSGEVRVAGRRLPPGRPDLAIRAGLGFAPEERKSEGLWLDWSMIRNTSIADLSRFRRGPFTDRASERREATRHLRSLNTQPDAPERPARLFSGATSRRRFWPAGCCAPVGAVTGRTDSRCRRWRTVGDLSGDRRVGRQRDRDRDGFQRLADYSGSATAYWCCVRATSSTSSMARRAPRRILAVGRTGSSHGEGRVRNGCRYPDDRYQGPLTAGSCPGAGAASGDYRFDHYRSHHQTRHLPDQRQPAQRTHPGQHHRHHRHRHDFRDRAWRH